LLQSSNEQSVGTVFIEAVGSLFGLVKLTLQISIQQMSVQRHEKRFVLADKLQQEFVKILLADIIRKQIFFATILLGGVFDAAVQVLRIVE
jgi:hypothetical protein